MKKHLGKYIFSSCLGAIVTTTPIFTTMSVVDNTICQSAIKNNASQNTNTYGITLSTYEIESWTNVNQKIQVFNNGVALNTVIWTVDDPSKFTVSENPDQNNYYSVNFIGAWSSSGTNESKIHAHWTDDNGFEHTATCVVRILHGYRVTTNNYDRTIKAQGTTTFKFQTNTHISTTDFNYDKSENATALTDFRLYTDDSGSLCLDVESRLAAGYGRVTFWIYHRLDGNKDYKTQVTVLIAENTITLNENNCSIRLNDSLTITPKLNDVEATKGSVSWYSSDPTVVSIKENATTSSIELIPHKQTTEPVVIYCYETLLTENVNFAACYVNITNSNLILSDKSKSQWDIRDEGFALTAKLDGVDIQPTNIVWSTSQSNIAHVNNAGIVIFERLGTVTISGVYTNANGVVFKDSYTFAITGPEFKSTPGQIVVIRTETPQKITATLDGATVDPSNLIFVSSDPTVATVDETGQLTYISSGTTQIHCYYKPYYYIQEYDAVTTVKLADPSLEFTLEWNNVSVGVQEQPHSLPKAYIGGIEIAKENLTWESSSENLQILPSSYTFTVSEPGDYTITCKYELGGETLSQTISVHAQEYFVNNFDTIEPTITKVSIIIGKHETFQLEFWFDSARTDPIEIKSAKSTNTKVATVTDSGLITFVGLGRADIICELIYARPDGNTDTVIATVHVHVMLPWWVWLLVGLGCALVIGGITAGIVIHKKKKNKKGKK